jgi:hypothetical protein
VTSRLKAGIVEQEEADIARQRLGKHISAANNQQAKIQELLEAMFSVWSAPKLYSEYQLEELVSWRLQSAVSIRELQVSSGSS